VLVGIGVVLAAVAFQLWVSPDNPPGFFRDEAALAYNAHTIAEDGRDEYGARFPLYFSSFLDYKSPVFVYALAGVFLVTGADREVARALSAVSMLAAVLLLGWLAYRRTGNAAVGVVTVALGGFSPWLFEVGRIAFEVAMEPLFLCLALLGVERVSRLDRWSPWTALSVAVALGAITYVYAGGRLLAPLLAAALVVVGLARWRWLLAAWLGFAVTQIPLLAYTRIHPGALTRRFDATTFVTDDMSAWEIAWRAAVNYVQDLQVWHYVVSGDVKPYAHTPGAGALLAASLLLSAAGLVLILVRLRSDPFWRYALAALAVSPVPAAFTIDRFHAVRLTPFAVMLVVVAIPAVAALRDAVVRGRRGARAVAAALVALAAVQLALFVENFVTDGPGRTGRFEVAVPTLLERAWADEGTVYVDFDDLEPLGIARWHALTRGIDQSRVVRLADGGIPPTGSIAFGRTQACDYACTRLAESGDYWIARVDGPPAG
jgi:4-amino-4-deoxy-L-arabinose transferase-like glycosyltransferase